ncbi:LysR family transcriptional regulator [Paraburkholderia nemoris]|uniref:helix-turn-helix domain-containing protein n=1 Tax=Paraburkholderia nemoris TaxID=2793076 RepID=UPI0038BB3E53
MAVADAGWVFPAARYLGVSKSIVSRRLFRLEAELGVHVNICPRETVTRWRARSSRCASQPCVNPGCSLQVARGRDNRLKQEHGDLCRRAAGVQSAPPANFCDERSTEMLDQQLGKDLDLSHGVLSWWPHDK